KHEAVLIDGGNNGKGSIVLAYLKKEGIADIDYLIATHPDADHIGGLDEIIDGFPVTVVYDNGESKTTKTYSDYLSRAQKSDYEVVKMGFSFTLDGVNFQVLHPSSSFKTDVNENSVVIRATYGNVDFLFTGDCEHSCEQDLLNSGAILDSEILKVGHHGSKTSTSNLFLNAVSPEVAVISVGDGNRYGHPHQETLDKLASVESYRTDLHGTIVVETDGTGYTVLTGKTAT
ncbi:MAG: ComEC/Rec2 family competence protein, partial [Candidatus Methanoperedens sp.]